MSPKDIINGCNLLVNANKGISLQEEFTLKSVPKLKQKDYSKLTHIELVNLVIKIIYQSLGRRNITPRDLKKAIVNMIEL